jgi:rfaE bifunctional protein kinase chain/domain
VRLGELLDSFRGMRALVVGDLMLDEYIFGRASRISPEAPVMVVRQQRTACVPGGAANVARNLAALGAEVDLIGVVGCDPAAEMLEESLREHGLGASGLVRDASRFTTRKTRVLADSAHQVLRIDNESDGSLAPEVEEALIARLDELSERADVIVVSDYIKGALSPRVSRQTVLSGKTRGVPVVVNPKPRSLRQFQDATLVSLNRKELVEATELWHLDSFVDDDTEGVRAAAQEAAGRLRDEVGTEHVLVTLGDLGMCTEAFSVRAPKVEVYDTAGAGDTVVATVALGLRARGFAPEVFELAVRTSSSVVKKVGVATPSAEDLAEIAGEVV